MKKILLMIFSLVFVLFISACQQTTTKPSGPYLGGTSGVSVDFVNTAPPTQFNQGEAVPLKVLLKNQGEEDLVAGNAQVRIYGVKVENFGLNNDYKAISGNLRGKSSLAQGGEQRIDFGTAKYTLDVVNSQDFTLRARLCYPYTTRGTIDICVKSGVAEEAGQGVCSVLGEKVVKGSISSGPIQITSLKEDTRGSDEVRFDITIENKGLGEVFTPQMKCQDYEDDTFRLAHKDTVGVKINNPLGIKCAFLNGQESNEGEVQLGSTGNVVLSCWMTTQQTYEDKLDLALSYYYFDKAEKKVTIFQR